MKILRGKTAAFRELLPEGLWETICREGSHKRFEDGQLIQDRGDKRVGLSLVNAGQIAGGKVDEGGVFIASVLLREGECFGEFTLFLGLPRSHSLWSVGNSEVTFINQERFARLLARYPQIYEALLKLWLWRSHEVLSYLDVQRRYSLAGRIIRLLLSASDEELNAGAVRCRQEDLGYMLGVSRVAIGKALKRLQSDGLLKIGYGEIALTNSNELRRRLECEERGLAS
jgi:CRP-like cAMP-binding protein